MGFKNINTKVLNMADKFCTSYTSVMDVSSTIATTKT